MKITKNILKQIIREELASVLYEESEEKPKYTSGKSPEERMHGDKKTKKTTKQEKSSIEKKIEDLNKRITRHQKNIKDGKDVDKNKKLLKRAQREKKKLAGF